MLLLVPTLWHSYTRTHTHLDLKSKETAGGKRSKTWDLVPNSIKGDSHTCSGPQFPHPCKEKVRWHPVQGPSCFTTSWPGDSFHMKYSSSVFRLFHLTQLSLAPPSNLCTLLHFFAMNKCIWVKPMWMSNIRKWWTNYKFLAELQACIVFPEFSLPTL